ncbi:hypothetical protein GQ473_00510 [archaeon]|nr:hypothetical protein [archaeon]
MSILERLDTLEERIEYYEDLIARIDNTLNEPFKYSRKKTTIENKEIAELRDIIGIVPKNKTKGVCFDTYV